MCAMSPMTAGSMPRPSEDAKAAFRSALPDDDSVSVRPMFGNIAAFHNGNMFAGLFGADLFVRLPEDEQATMIERGGAEFSPMPGRAMKGYVTVPPSWPADLDATRGWILQSLELARSLPPKEPAKRKR
jgi:TfoX/Sxy family transcriptional regulator of competence genes